jgi:hypothetical protein
MCSSVPHSASPKTRDSTSASPGLQRDSDSDIGEQKHEAESTFAAQSKCPRHGLMSARSSGQLQDLYGLLKILKKKLEQE